MQLLLYPIVNVGIHDFLQVARPRAKSETV
jgi:hypothetical protein